MKKLLLGASVIALTCLAGVAVANQPSDSAAPQVGSQLSGDQAAPVADVNTTQPIGADAAKTKNTDATKTKSTDATALQTSSGSATTAAPTASVEPATTNNEQSGKID